VQVQSQASTQANATTLNQAVFDRWESFCATPYGPMLLFLWAAAEAVFWPVFPDFLLLPMAVGGRQRYWRMLGAAVLGSTVGGIIIYLFAFFVPRAAESLVPRLPLVQGFMLQRADLALAQQGVMAFWTQPFSGVSFRFYALLGGIRGLNPFLVISVSFVARGLRMLVGSAAAVLLASRFPVFFRNAWIYCVLIYLLLTGYMWLVTQIIG
jgi:membrane protein YqaA with SNARE-associated domain